MLYEIRSTVTNLMIILLVWTMLVTILSYNSSLFAQEISNKTNPFINNTNSALIESEHATNFDIPSVGLTLPDNSSVSTDLSSIYFNSGGKGQTTYAYYDDFGLPEKKPAVKVGDNFSIDVYNSHSNTPNPVVVKASISKILSGQETGNYTAMTLDKPINLTSSGNTFTIPNTPPGSYILNTFLNYRLGGIGIVYTIQLNIT